MPDILRQPFSFSQSCLQDYADCPRRFRLRYVDQLTWPAVESEPVAENEHRQQEGQIFHRLVQQHLLGLPTENLARLANTPNLAVNIMVGNIAAGVIAILLVLAALILVWDGIKALRRLKTGALAEAKA